MFDLRCGGGHVFEAWFGSTADYEGQRGRGLVTCPLCGDGEVAKAVMAPAVPAKGNRRSDVVRPAETKPVAAGSDMAAVLLQMQRTLEAKSEWVGDRFASEARGLHDRGEMRSIHGRATLAEAQALADDGVPLLPLPFTPRAASDA